MSNKGRQGTERRSYKQNYTLEWMYGTTSENRQYLARMENPKKQALADKIRILEQSMTFDE